ncbi:MAG: NAD(P)-dependent glycerol-3-phosphate dehydrogenase [Solobacterium sp.]|nr:NAD(P)-dependent glycerol-3-phosphate dehydrogenase [Solobacterium sp.]
MKKIGVLGAGTWGTALAVMCTKAGHDVTVWSAIGEEVDVLAETRKQKNLPGMIISMETKFTKSLEEVCRDKDALLFVVPSVYVRSTAAQAAEFIEDGQLIVDAAKGIEKGTLYTMTQVIGDEMRKAGKQVRLCALTGPTHAEEVALGLPTLIVSASDDIKAAEEIQDIFMNPVFRVYTNTDMLGAELCGAVKNIIALAAGISGGLGYGDNARAALITRGMAEIKRLGMAMGCEEATFDGLAGMGDLIVTATSTHSRNNRCGTLIGQGLSAEEAIKQVGMVVEGINAIPAVMELAEKYHVEMPISEAVKGIVFDGKDARTSVNALMTRDRKGE